MRKGKAEHYAYLKYIIKEYKASDLTREDFCKARQVSFKKFKYYRYQLGKQAQALSDEPSLAEVPVRGEGADTVDALPFMHKFPTGLRLTITPSYNEQCLAQLVKVLCVD